MAKYELRGTSFKDWANMEGNEKGQELLKQWDYDTNIFKLRINTRKITYSSSKEVYWKCDKCGQSYLAKVCQRTHNNKQCPYCNKHHAGTSIPEQKLYEIFKTLYPDTINRDRHLGFELDIYIPELNMAIEYNGSYYHKILHDLSARDAMKAMRCAEEEICLIQVWDDGDSTIPEMSEDCKNVYFKCKQNIIYKQMTNVADLIISNVIYANAADEESKHELTNIKAV